MDMKVIAILALIIAAGGLAWRILWDTKPIRQAKKSKKLKPADVEIDPDPEPKRFGEQLYEHIVGEPKPKGRIRGRPPRF